LVKSVPPTLRGLPPEPAVFKGRGNPLDRHTNATVADSCIAQSSFLLIMVRTDGVEINDFTLACQVCLSTSVFCVAIEVLVIGSPAFSLYHLERMGRCD
jgi:hypothetical protein